MRIAIIGAGIAGLTCAYRLQQQGHDIQVFEQTDRPGGRMSTIEAQGLRVDTGANLLLSHYTCMKALADELNVPWFPFQVGKGGVLREGALTSFTPSSVWDVLRYQGLRVRSRLALLKFLFDARRSDCDFFDLPGTAYDDQDAYAYTHALSPELADFLADTFVRTFHFHGAHKLSTRFYLGLASLFTHKGGFVPHGFKDHMIALPRALAAQVPVQYGTTIASVIPRNQDVEVVSDTRERFDRVVLATPAPVSKALLQDPTPAQRRILEHIDFAPTLSVAFKVPKDVPEDFEGIWIPYSESTLISECTNETCKGSSNATHTVLNLCVNEEAVNTLWKQDDQAIYTRVAEEWGRLFPQYQGQMQGLHIQRWPHAMPIYAPGSLTELHAFWPQQGINHVYFCGDWLGMPWTEGALRCGERVARLIGTADL